MAFQVDQRNTILGAKQRAFWRTVKTVVACCACVFVTLASLAAAQPTLADRPRAFNLSEYPASMRPPDFTARTTHGETVSLSSLQGKVVLLNFWASWCLECRPEMTMFERLHREFTAQGLAVVGVNVREGSKTIEGYAKAEGLSFPLLMDPDGTIYAAYGVIGLPTTFLIGRDGRPVALAVGPRDWGSGAARAIIQNLLAESVTPRGTR